MRCPECGLENLPQLDRCMRCGRGLARELTPWSEIVPPRRSGPVAAVQPSPARTRRLLRTGRTGIRRLWNLLWYQVDTSDEDVIAHRSPTLAGLLSLIPGLGHAYVRRFAVGVGLLALFAAGIASVLVASRSPVSTIIAYCLVGLQAAAVSLAIAEARRQNGDTVVGPRFVGAVLLAVGLLSGAYTAGWVVMTRSYWPIAVVTDLYSTETGMTPGGTQFVSRRLVFRLGDRMLVDARPRASGALKGGDIVWFRIPGYEGNLALEPVLAGPGDMLTVADGHVWRNARELTGEELPYLPTGGAVTVQPMSFTVAPGQYIVSTYGFILGPMHAEPEHAQVASFAAITRGAIVGKVIVIYNPPAHRRRF